MPSDPNQPLVGATRPKRTREMEQKELGVTNGLLILRKVNASEFNDPAWDEQLEYEWGKTYVQLDDGTTWVNDDFPRNPELTADIMANTIGFGLFNKNTLELLGSYRDLARALQAATGAKVKITTELEFEEQDESDNPTSQIGRAAKRAVAAA